MSYKTDQALEIIEEKALTYIESYKNTWGEYPDDEHLASVIQELECLAKDKEKKDVIGRCSNWSPKDIYAFAQMIGDIRKNIIEPSKAQTQKQTHSKKNK